MTNDSRAVPFTRPWLAGDELRHVAEAAASGHLAGDGGFTAKCHAWLRRRTGCDTPLLTHSCTAALDMAALLLDIRPGDEVIMPSYTFVSTANAFVLRGGVPVFVDIREDTLNLDERLIEEAITPRTRALVPVHYAGVGCEMDVIMALARKHGLAVVEDAAQGVGASYAGRALGSIGHLGALSFHETKNVVSGEGGALLVNDPSFAHRAEVIREKGTDRSRFLRGEVDKYTWQDIGSSFLPSELTAAFLYGQFEHVDAINAARMRLWERYHDMLAGLEERGILRRPVVPARCSHNAHMYYVLMATEADRRLLLDGFRRAGIRAVFHYVPLHDSPAGLRYGRTVGNLPVTTAVAARLVRLPLWVGLTEEDQDRVVAVLGR